MPPKDVMAYGNKAESALPFPIIADDKREVAVQLGMLDPDEIDKDGMPLTARCVSPRSPCSDPQMWENVQRGLHCR